MNRTANVTVVSPKYPNGLMLGIKTCGKKFDSHSCVAKGQHRGQHACHCGAGMSLRPFSIRDMMRFLFNE